MIIRKDQQMAAMTEKLELKEKCTNSLYLELDRSMHDVSAINIRSIDLDMEPSEGGDYSQSVSQLNRRSTDRGPESRVVDLLRQLEKQSIELREAEREIYLLKTDLEEAELAKKDLAEKIKDMDG